MENHLFGYQRNMHTSLILSGLRKCNDNHRIVWKESLHGVYQVHGWFIDGAKHVSRKCWDTPRIATTWLENGSMNGHSILGSILQTPSGSERNFCQCLVMNLRKILNLTLTTNQERHSYLYTTEMEMHFPVQLLHKRCC